MKHTHTITYEIFADWKELAAADQELIVLAQEAADQAYAPYSEFHVGAALRLDDGTLIKGNNQENIAYPSGLCAERVALFYAGANFPDKSINTLAIVAKGSLLDAEACLSPCGSCRQVMAQSEFRQEGDLRVLLVSQNGKTYVFDRATDLLVFPFGM
ncbi:MAG: cytidine deaminase [Fluviicola sp.]|jgi:cytidine deaminase